MYCRRKQQSMENTYGFSLRTRQEPMVPATSMRIAQAMIQCLIPSILELVPTSTDADLRTKRQAQLRFRLEQLKFAIRIYLMCSYWYQISIESKCATTPGIMLGGALYQVSDEPDGISDQQWQGIQRRRRYKGRRTGLAISKDSTCDMDSPPSSTRRVLLGELLYAFRSIWWAHVEARHSVGTHPLSSSWWQSPLFRAWLTTLGMDLISLGLLSKEGKNGNVHTRYEWNRRRMKLFVYVLRAPIWNRLTSPFLEQATSAIQKIPLLGGLIHSYLWDWIYYWKHPYYSEEG